VSSWQAIIFDLDDTLYPERDYVLSGFRAVAQWAASHAAIPADTGYASLHELFAQGVRGDTFNRWAAMHGHDPATLVPECVRAYREHQPALTPFAGVPALLASLRQHYKLGLVSDGYLGVQRRKLAGLQLAASFDAVVFSDELGRAAWKPSPQPFEEVARRLGIAPSAAVYVADNPAKDFLGARRAGMASIWLRRPGGEYTHLDPATPAHAPDLTVATLPELADCFAVKVSS
jgi:putative hydrolase of the HAD superfamily